MATALVAAESLLALTPIVIKKTLVDPTRALWSRTITAAVIGYLVSTDRTLTMEEIGAAALLGYTNLLHISSSYEAFRNLPAGQAMSIMYTYPLWILLINAYFNGESISARSYNFMGVATAGAALLSYNPGETPPPMTGGTPSQGWGLLTAGVAAITEASMHGVLKRLAWKDAGKSVWVVSAGAALWLLVSVGFSGIFSGILPDFMGTPTDVAKLTIFHGLTTFIGYYLRFYAVPRLSTVTYSVLSYSGIFASYLFGLWFLGEKPSAISLLGALLILVSGIFLMPI
jgi:drug/metabolite transporter (DMT)-like permease